MPTTIDARPEGVGLTGLVLADTDTEPGSSLTGTSAAGSFWLVPSLLIALVIIVGLIARQRERARRGTRDA